MRSFSRLGMEQGLIVTVSLGFYFQPSAWADDRGLDRTTPLTMIDGMTPSSDAIDYQGYDSPGRSGGSPTMVDQRENGRVLVSKTETNTWSVNERVSELDLGQPIAIPQTTITTSRDLWSVEAGAAYRHAFSEGRQLGLNFGVGSDSDHPFYSLHETVFRAGANYRLPTSEKHGWIFSLTYSNNRHFFNGIPLPGVGYSFDALDDRLQGILGFPYALLRYRPDQNWTTMFSIFGPRNVSAEIVRHLYGPLSAYTGFQWNSQEWLIADRQDYSNRLVFDKKRAALGLRAALSHGLLLDLSGGRQFDQRFFVHDSSSYHDVPTAGLAPTWFIQSQLTYRFSFPSSEATR